MGVRLRGVWEADAKGKFPVENFKLHHSVHKGFPSPRPASLLANGRPSRILLLAFIFVVVFFDSLIPFRVPVSFFL